MVSTLDDLRLYNQILNNCLLKKIAFFLARGISMMNEMRMHLSEKQHWFILLPFCNWICCCNLTMERRHYVSDGKSDVILEILGNKCSFMLWQLIRGTNIWDLACRCYSCSINFFNKYGFWHTALGESFWCFLVLWFYDDI